MDEIFINEFLNVMAEKSTKSFLRAKNICNKQNGSLLSLDSEWMIRPNRKMLQQVFLRRKLPTTLKPIPWSLDLCRSYRKANVLICSCSSWESGESNTQEQFYSMTIARVKENLPLVNIIDCYIFAVPMS